MNMIANQSPPAFETEKDPRHSNSWFYEKSNRIQGMTFSKYRLAGVDTPIRFAVGECSLGALLMAMSPMGVCAISMGDDPGALARDLQDRFPRAEVIGGDSEFERCITQVIDLIEAPALEFDLPLDVRGTAFQHRVWRALLEIPAGVTVSYSELAGRIGAPKSVRAVAGACAANQLAVVIPCHRVVRNDGAVSGYRWGAERKIELLRREIKHDSHHP